MQNALVTGAASGIGAAAVELLRARGYRVLAVDLTPGAGIVTSDVADPAAWARLAALVRDEMGELHLAHLNAGVPSRQPNIAELTDRALPRSRCCRPGVRLNGVRVAVNRVRRYALRKLVSDVGMRVEKPSVETRRCKDELTMPDFSKCSQQVLR